MSHADFFIQLTLLRGRVENKNKKTMKKVLLTAVSTLSLAAATLAQTVPNYVPTNGLVGWWPFNGNANDESGNNNNGTVNGATLTTDRFGNTNKAFSFDGISNYIDIGDPTNNLFDFFGANFTISAWVSTISNQLDGPIVTKQSLGVIPNVSGDYNMNIINGQGRFAMGMGNGQGAQRFSISQVNDGNWHHIVAIYVNNNIEIYVDGVLENGFYGGPNVYPSVLLNSIESLRFGKGWTSHYEGKLDDIGILNRALTQQEITDLYNAVNCNLSITPQNNVLQIGNTATFNATTSDANPTYIWQSDFGQGFQTLNNYGNYSGVNTNTLTVANVQLANHNQAIRAISTSGNCVDTSNVAYIHIADTCITTTNETIYDTTFVTVTDTNYVTVYDTVTTYISVTDTLFINVNTVGLNNNTIINTIKVFPNPANTNLNLDFGNFTNLNGYSIKIYNSLSQVIYNQPITQQSETIDLSTFGGNGIYFLHVINAQNNTVEISKIVLQ
jgi:hypothetical protein